ncbi:hypothetical protein [Nocardia aurantiaca]|uniref:Uncharacterized protein n=1 Tax=Nocardia aurantiaca TaxID=2675850 RepID=A0A6I3L6B3_9NOCA|nr:hypothetical protein [Nocardia aurantiaca]MTE17031.1 hypothetical protein [Nocardia aurantiaca]
MQRGLRCARVAIVFDGGPHWSYWARRALHLASQTWGGTGFVLVPHQQGRVAPALLRAVRAYDPDYVVTYRSELVDFEYFSPGALKLLAEDGSALTGVARWNALAGSHIDMAPTEIDEMARDQVAAVCSTYKLATAEVSSEDVQQYGHRAEDFPATVRMPGLAVDNCVQAPPSWGGLLGVAVASHAGSLDAPNPAAGEPELDDGNLAQLTRWLMGTGSLPPESLARRPLDGAGFSDLGRAWDYTTTGLTGVVRMRDSSESALVVVGDTAEDFALARLWQRTYMNGIWLPSALGTDRDDLPRAVLTGLDKIFSKARSGRGTVTVTSTSLPPEKLSEVLARFRVELSKHWGAGVDEIGEAVTAQELVWPRHNTMHLAIGEQFDDPISVPTEVDGSGTTTMLTPLPPPALENRVLAQHPELTWHVDIAWPDGRSVLGGGLTGHELLTPTGGLPVTLARSSRYGTSYPSKRYDFVPGGIPAVNRLPRPKLRDLSLADWVDAKLAQHDLTSRLSSAGHKAAQLERMYGDRQSVIDLFSGPLLPALRTMDAKGERSDDCYPKQEGVQIRAHYGVLNFSGFTTQAPQTSKEQIRQDLDKALRAGVIRRGLVLQCVVCTEIQFQPIDRIGQRWTCERCDAGNDLDQPAWKKPLQEPGWYYDLHPVGRQLLDQNGEVPLALASYLARTGGGGSTYQDLAEIELVRGRTAQVELDLFAYCDGVRIVGEAKSANHLSGNTGGERAKEIHKKCRAAVWLDADELVFATSEAEWKPGAEAGIRDAVAAFEWPPIGPPVIRMVAGLDFAGTVTSKVVLLQ